MATSSTLRQAASAVFAVTTVVPLLIFVWTLYVLNTLSKSEAQVGLGLALAISLLGYYIFRGLVAQMSSVIASLGKALETAPAATVTPKRAPVAAASVSATRATALAPAGVPAPAAAEPAAPTDTSHAVPGLGAIQEVQDLNRAMAALWQNEATAFKGQRVVISVVNSPRPISGTLVMLSHDGLLIQTDRLDHVAVGYSRISAIDAEE